MRVTFGGFGRCGLKDMPPMPTASKDRGHLVLVAFRIRV
jgi:hypothetical protein